MTNNFYDNKGYINLLTVLILGAIGVVVMIALTATAITHSRTVAVLDQSVKAQGLADACIEVALQVIYDTQTASATNNLSLGAGSCTYVISDGGGESRTIQSTATVQDVVRRVEVFIDQINPQIHIVLWQEVDAF